jgi:hypothetical protein
LSGDAAVAIGLVEAFNAYDLDPLREFPDPDLGRLGDEQRHRTLTAPPAESDQWESGRSANSRGRDCA